MTWHELILEINGNPLMALGFYGIVGVIVGIPMKVAGRVLSRIPLDWINKDSAPAMIAFPTLLLAWFVIRWVPDLDANALFVALGLGGTNALLGRRVMTPAANAVEDSGAVGPASDKSDDG
jgi:hypothetical protein